MIKILIPIDFSTTSINALRYALQLFKDKEAEFNIFYTYTTSSTAFHMRSMDGILKKDGEDQMKSLLLRINRDFPDKIIHHKVIKGDPIDVTLHHAKSGEFNLVIMGTKGASGLKEVFVGSVAGEVIAKSAIGVIVVPDGYIYNGLHNIVLAIETPALKEETLQPITILSKYSDAKIQLLHILRGSEPDMELNPDYFKFIDPEIINYSCDNDINSCLTSFVEEKGPGMLGLIRGKKGFFTRIFSGSVTLSQTFHSHIPLLIMKEE